MPKFSIVIAVYNKEQHIARTLKSVLHQTFTDFEIVIVNDGSTDESERIIKSFNNDKIRYFKQENMGAAAGRNTAIKLAKSSYIALLDADDTWFPNYLEEQNRLIENYPNEFIFATAQEIIKNNTVRHKKYSLSTEFKNEGIVDYFEASYLASILHSSSTVIKKEVFSEIGFYNTSIKSGQDTDLYIRIGLNYTIVFSSCICASYYVIENSLFRSTSSLNEKADFSAYDVFCEEHPSLKKFLDLNRFSLAVFAKLTKDKAGFKKNLEKIKRNNLNFKQRLLLYLSPKTIQFLYRLKIFFERFNFYFSAFK